MSELTTEEKVRELPGEQLGCDYDEVTLSARLAEDLDADSLDMVEIVMAVELEFDVFLEDEDDDRAREKVKTVADVVALVEQMLAAKASHSAGGAR